VLAIVALLVAIILPAISGARETGRRAVCASNLRQYAIGLTTYAFDWKQETPPHFPALGYSATMFVSQGPPALASGSPFTSPTSVLGPTWWDLRELLRPYITDLRVMGCPSLSAPPVDSPANVRPSCYGQYDNFAGRGRITYRSGGALVTIPDRLPDFGLRDGVPGNMDKLGPLSSSMPIVQDRIWFQGTGSIFHYNHGAGTAAAGPDLNPTDVRRFSGRVGDVAGGNIGHYDGHVRWYRLGQLDIVGPIHGIPAQAYRTAILSKLPTEKPSPNTAGWVVPGIASH
jgi:hypothetical protein